jgi:hypothetical protein
MTDRLRESALLFVATRPKQGREKQLLGELLGGGHFL